MSPELEQNVMMFIQAIAARCKTCITVGRCSECFSFAAKKLLNDIAFDRVKSFSESTATFGRTAAEKYILDQLKPGKAIRGNHLETLYPMSVREKRELLSLMVQRGLIVVERRGWRDKNYSYYSLPCNDHPCSTQRQSSTLFEQEQRKDRETTSPMQSSSDSKLEQSSS